MALTGAKICPLCGTLHSAAALRCLKDGATLEAIEDVDSKPAQDASSGLAAVVVQATPPPSDPVFGDEKGAYDDLDSDFDDDFEADQPTAVGFDEDLLAAARAAAGAEVFDPESADPDDTEPTLVSIDPVTESAVLAATADNLSAADVNIPEVMITRETLLPNLDRKVKKEAAAPKSAVELFDALMSANPPGSAPAPIVAPKSEQVEERPGVDDPHDAPTIPEVALSGRVEDGEEEIEVEQAEKMPPSILSSAKADEALDEAIAQAPSADASTPPRPKRPGSGAIHSADGPTASGAVITPESTDEVLYGFKPHSTGTAAMARPRRGGGKLWIVGAVVVMALVAAGVVLLLDSGDGKVPSGAGKPGAVEQAMDAGVPDRGQPDQGKPDQGKPDQGKPDVPKTKPDPKTEVVPKPRVVRKPKPKVVRKPKPRRRPRPVRKKPRPKRPQKGKGLDNTVDPFAE